MCPSAASTSSKKTEREPPRSELAILRRYIASYGLKMTTQREKILEVFLRTPGHVTAEHLYDCMKRVDSGIGFTTVYRTLRLFCGCGLAQERKFGSGPTRYEHAHTRQHHDHLVCVKCGKIIEFENKHIEELQKKVAKTYAFELLDHRHELYGHCKECQVT
jgi:Fur family ferric uptake transcriptional regulator